MMKDIQKIEIILRIDTMRIVEDIQNIMTDIQNMDIRNFPQDAETGRLNVYFHIFDHRNKKYIAYTY